MKHRSLIWKISRDEFLSLVESSNSRKEILGKLGLHHLGGNYKTLNDRMVFEGIDIKQFQLKVERTKRRPAPIPLERILVETSFYSRDSLRRRLIKEGLLLEKCAECDVGPVWNGKPLTLHLDHINGTPTDNRLNNLRILCPNCHSQTSTYGSKKNRKPSRVYLCSVCGKRITRYAKSGKCVSCVKYGDYSSEVERLPVAQKA